jgi:prolyl oligopeptidase
VYHGITVGDPYRWLEAGDDPSVTAWVEAQNTRTRDALDAIASRPAWRTRLAALNALAVVQAVQLRGERVFLLERAAGADQAQLVVRPVGDALSAPRLLADPASSTADGAAAVDWFHPSPDGSLVAFGVSEGGTENSVLRIVRSNDASLLADEIPVGRACSLAWEPDSSGFVYTRYPPDGFYDRTVHQHRLGDAWGDDPVVWAERPTPESWPNVTMSPNGRYVVIESTVGWSRTDLHVLDRSDGEWRDLIAGVEAVSSGWLFADEATLIGVTTLGAEHGRVVRVDLGAPDVGPSSWESVVAESDRVLRTAAPIGEDLLLVSSRAGVDRIDRVTRDGVVEPVDGLGLCSVVDLAADRDTGVGVAIITGFDRPPALWTIADRLASPWRRNVDAGGVPALTVQQVEFTSSDGTSVPMFVIQPAGTQPPDRAPAPARTILNGYGGFAIAETPMWSPLIAAWCEAGGTYAIAGLRGGYEYGEAWHHAGRRGRKQNVFDDFHAAADWLVEAGYATRGQLAIAGGSNGGLLVGAAITQRPDLCRAAWCAVPLLDMIRYPQFLIARLWTDEYGDPDDPEQFGWLYAYSPYHHVVDGEHYPAVLFTTAEGDGRVDPLHARKMAALMQSAAIGQDERPVLLHQEGRAGHGVGKPVSKRVDEQADVLAFFDDQLDPD